MMPAWSSFSDQLGAVVEWQRVHMPFWNSLYMWMRRAALAVRPGVRVLGHVVEEVLEAVHLGRHRAEDLVVGVAV